ncbi:hypothetical protein BY996DRAFT_4580184, partial [Phakopsora pachyrhizi]
LVVIRACHVKRKGTSLYSAFLSACYDPKLESFQTICKLGTSFTDEILELIYKKILPLELTVKKNYFNVDEIKPDVYSAAKGLCGDGMRRVSLRFPRSRPEQSSHLQRYNQPEAQSRKQRSIERLKDNDSLNSELNNQVDGLREGLGTKGLINCLG